MKTFIVVMSLLCVIGCNPMSSSTKTGYTLTIKNKLTSNQYSVATIEYYPSGKFINLIEVGDTKTLDDIDSGTITAKYTYTSNLDGSVTKKYKKWLITSDTTVSITIYSN